MSIFCEWPVLGDEYSPKKNAPYIFVPITALGVVLGLCGIVANFIVLVDGPFSSKATTIFKLRILRCFAIWFCCMLIAAEIEWRQFLHTTAIMRNWVARSIFYFFLGAMTLAPAENEWYYDYCFGVSFAITGFACLYFVMGCIRKSEEHLATLTSTRDDASLRDLKLSVAAVCFCFSEHFLTNQGLGLVKKGYPGNTA